MSALRDRILPFVIWLFYRGLMLTWRIRIDEAPEYRELRASGAPLVYAHWHGDELAILHQLKPRRAAAMVSTSRDGELMARVISLLGARTSRGSSTRGGVSALKGILRLSREGWQPSVAVDGPKGPYHKVKPGVFEISRITGGAIVPLAGVASSAGVFEKSWNKTFLPKPFSKIQVVYGVPLPALGRESDSRDLKLAEGLESALANAKQHARNLIATP